MCVLVVDLERDYVDTGRRLQANQVAVSTTIKSPKHEHSRH